MRRRDLLIGSAAAALAAVTTGPTADAAVGMSLEQRMHPHLSHVMQDFAVDSAGRHYVSQAEWNPGGTENVVISRLDRHGRTLDYMRLVGAGHGIGLDVQTIGRRPWVSLTWTDASAASAGRAREHVTFAYHPSSSAGWSRADCVRRFGLTVSPFMPAETLAKIDPARHLAACGQWEGEPGRQLFTLRRLQDLRTGTDRVLGRISAPIAGGTFQGCTTIGSKLYRLLGTGARDGQMSRTDPIRVEVYSWATGRKTGSRTLHTLGQIHGAWPDGYAEPEGMTAARGADGRTHLLVGVVTGLGPHRQWRTYQLTGI